VNFLKLLDFITAGRKLVKAVAFVVDNGGSAFSDFSRTLKRAGWELRIKRPKTFADGSVKADWDMGLAMEAVSLRGQAATVVLVSGDGDFAPLVRQLKRWNHRVEVAAYRDGLSSELREVADGVLSLGDSILE
jgi:uncharacterized LabA/DUF88 family protein